MSKTFRITVFAVALALFGLMLSGIASAHPVGIRAHHGTNCEQFIAGSVSRQFCITVNTQDTLGGGQAEALVFDGNGGQLLNVAFKVDWIHLYRNGNVVREAGPTGYLTGSNNSFSTDFIGVCQSGENQYRAVVRMRIKNLNSGVRSTFRRFDSSVVGLGGGVIC